MFVGCREELLKPVVIPQVQFSDKVCTSSYATLGENIETRWVTFAWCLALSMFTVRVRGLLCRSFCPWRFHRCSSWMRLSSCPLRADTWGPDVQKTVVFTVAVCQVVDDPVRAVHRRLWMSLRFRSDSGALAGGASDSIHRRSWWTFQPQRQGFLRGLMAMRG